MKYCINIDIINRFISDKRLTKTKFCKMCKISISTLNRIMKNEGNFCVTTIFKITKLIEVKFSEIILKP